MIEAETQTSDNTQYFHQVIEIPRRLVGLAARDGFRLRKDDRAGLAYRRIEEECQKIKKPLPLDSAEELIHR